jgi:hypothetical protein
LLGDLFQSPARKAASHATILLVASLGWGTKKTDAAVEAILDLPVLSVVRTGGPVSTPIDVVFDDDRGHW